MYFELGRQACETGSASLPSLSSAYHHVYSQLRFGLTPNSQVCPSASSFTQGTHLHFWGGVRKTRTRAAACNKKSSCQRCRAWRSSTQLSHQQSKRILLLPSLKLKHHIIRELTTVWSSPHNLVMNRKFAVCFHSFSQHYVVPAQGKSL